MHWKAFFSAFGGAYLGSLLWELLRQDDDNCEDTAI